MVIIKKFLIILSIVLLLCLTPFVYIQVKKHISLNKVMEYLIEEKGYDESDIFMIESKWTTGIPNYYVKVTFQNEPNIVYLYFAHDIKGQFEYYDIRGIKVPIRDLKNYDPYKNNRS